MLTVLADWLQPWAQLYRGSAAVQAVVLFGHLGAVALAGGLAVGTDRKIIRLRRTSAPARLRVLREWSRAHRFVLAGLGVGILTGVAMLLSDVARFLPYWVFWLKMLLLTTLLVNGRRLEREARALRAILETAGDAPSDTATTDREPGPQPDRKPGLEPDRKPGLEPDRELGLEPDRELDLEGRWSRLREASVRSAWLWAATLLAGVLVTTA